MTFRSSRAHPEEKFHRDVAGYLDLALPDGCWYTTIGHGGGGEFRGIRLKAAGMKAGVPDILLISNSIALFIELKSNTGVLSDTQKETIPAIEKAGGRVKVCRTLEDVETALLAWNIQPKVRLTSGKITDPSTGMRLHTGKTAWAQFRPR